MTNADKDRCIDIAQVVGVWACRLALAVGGVYCAVKCNAEGAGACFGILVTSFVLLDV